MVKCFGIWKNLQTLQTKTGFGLDVCTVVADEEIMLPQRYMLMSLRSYRRRRALWVTRRGAKCQKSVLWTCAPRKLIGRFNSSLEAGLKQRQKNSKCHTSIKETATQMFVSGPRAKKHNSNFTEIFPAAHYPISYFLVWTLLTKMSTRCKPNTKLPHRRYITVFYSLKKSMNGN